MSMSGILEAMRGGSNPHCHANTSSIIAGSLQGNCSARRRAHQRRSCCAGVMALSKIGGLPNFVNFAGSLQAKLDRASSHGIECCAWMPQL